MTDGKPPLLITDWKIMIKKENPNFFFFKDVVFSILPGLEAISGLKICKLSQVIQKLKEEKAFYFLR